MKTTINAFAAIAAILAISGCGDRGPSLSEVEAKERTTRLYSNAMDDYQAGRLDAAINGFDRVVLDEPKSYSAHFQLATLLQDVKKDYIGAIAHYRAYLKLRPASDKATVAQDRVKLCETLLEAKIANKVAHGPDVLKTENKRLQAEKAELEKKLKETQAALTKAESKVATLVRENTMQHGLLKKLSSDDTAKTPPPATAKEALALLKELEGEDDRKSLKPTDAELLDDGDDDTEKSEDRIRDSEDMKKLKAQLAEDEKNDAANPAVKKPDVKGQPKTPAFDALLGGKDKTNAAKTDRPKTYTVSEGDTLFGLSTRFYGSNRMWRKIREANKAVIPPDGRLRAGQEITLP